MRRKGFQISLMALVALLLFTFASCANQNEYIIREDETATENDGVHSSNMKEAQSTDSALSGERLSDTCDAVLAEGTDSDGSYYELVAVQEESSTSVQVKVGVIKNNEWLVPLSADHPFVDSETGLLWYYDTFNYTEYRKTHALNGQGYARYDFIGNGCFYFDGCFYNAEMQKMYQESWDERKSDSIERYLIPYTFYSSNLEDIDKKFDFQNIIITSRSAIYEGDRSVKLLDTETMEVSIISIDGKYVPVAPCSERLFCASGEGGYAFFNLQGEKVIDLSQYNIDFSPYLSSDYDNQMVFINGECTFIAVNSAGNEFKIVIDKSGNVLSETVIQS